MIVVWVLLVVLLLHICFAMIELKCLTTTYYEIKSTKLPKDFGGLKIVLLSDIHCCSFGKKNKRLYDKIKAANPDIIIIAGDMINGMKPDENIFAEEFLTGLKSLSFPVYYTYGNHEERYKLRGEEVFDKFKNICQNNANLVNNETVHIRNNIYLTGLDLPEYVYKRGGDYTVNVQKDAETAILNFKESDNDISGNISGNENERFIIMTAHDPEHFELYRKAGADLVLSGHVHGGILRFPVVGGFVNPKLKFFPKYDKGVFEYNNGKMVLSGGIGWHNLPLRFMNKPEVVVIDLKR